MLCKQGLKYNVENSSEILTECQKREPWVPKSPLLVSADDSRDPTQTERSYPIFRNGHGQHQKAFVEDWRLTGKFRNHKGLHRFKILFLGKSPATELFHDWVESTLCNLSWYTSIYDNIFVWKFIAVFQEVILTLILISFTGHVIWDSEVKKTLNWANIILFHYLPSSFLREK